MLLGITLKCSMLYSAVEDTGWSMAEITVLELLFLQDWKGGIQVHW